MKQLSEEEFQKRVKQKETRFRAIELREVSLVGSEGVGLVFRECFFERVDLGDVNWEQLKASNCQFINCRFSHANLVEAQFENCTFFDPAALAGCDFKFALLRYTRFKNCNLNKSLLEHTSAFQLTIEASQAVETSFAGTKFNGGAILTNSAFRFGNFKGIDFSKCNLAGSDFEWANLDEVTFKNANLSGSNLGNASLKNVIFTGADLRGAVLGGLNPAKVDLQGAIIFESQMSSLLENLGLVIQAEETDR